MFPELNLEPGLFGGYAKCPPKAPRPCGENATLG